MSNVRLIKGNTSVFLDSLRLGAALTVLITHASDFWFPIQQRPPSQPGHFDHTAVVVFFCLSGYVIAYTVSNRNQGLLQYAKARLSRLYSIVAPALLVTALVELIMFYEDPALYSLFSKSNPIVRYFFSGLFLNEVWYRSAAPPINGPLWSLSFEFWYYIIFGLWFFRGTSWKSLLLPLLACIVAGPKILLMMPIWLAGCIAYRLNRPVLNPTLSWVFVFSALLTAGIIASYVTPFPDELGTPSLYYASQYLTDWLVGLSIAAALWILPSSDPSEPQKKWVAYYRKIADLTFPIYVLSNPLFFLFRIIFGFKMNDNTQLWQAIVSVLIVSMLIGIILEKQRIIWEQFFKWLLRLIRNTVVKNVPLLNYSSKI